MMKVNEQSENIKEIVPICTIEGNLKKYWCDFGHELDLYEFNIEVDKTKDPHIWLSGPCQTCIDKNDIHYIVPYDTSEL